MLITFLVICLLVLPTLSIIFDLFDYFDDR